MLGQALCCVLCLFRQEFPAFFIMKRERSGCGFRVAEHLLSMPNTMNLIPSSMKIIKRERRKTGRENGGREKEERRREERGGKDEERKKEEGKGGEMWTDIRKKEAA